MPRKAKETPEPDKQAELERALEVLGEAIKADPNGVGAMIGQRIAPYAAPTLASLGGLLGRFTVQITYTPPAPRPPVPPVSAALMPSWPPGAGM